MGETFARTVRRLHAANALCLLALKQATLGRDRIGDDAIFQRDHHDAYLLIDTAAADIATQIKGASYEVRTRALDAVVRLAGGADAMTAAAREMVTLDAATSRRSTEATVGRTALRMQRALARGSGA